jgi:hypothetical protein
MTTTNEFEPSQPAAHLRHGAVAMLAELPGGRLLVIDHDNCRQVVEVGEVAKVPGTAPPSQAPESIFHDPPQFRARLDGRAPALRARAGFRPDAGPRPVAHPDRRGSPSRTAS